MLAAAGPAGAELLPFGGPPPHGQQAAWVPGERRHHLLQGLSRALVVRPLVHAADLHLSYGATHVLRSAEFIINPGDKVALVGPNGAGKTTIFKILAGLLKPDAGEFDSIPDLRVAYLPQIPDLPPETPVGELLAAPTSVAKKLDDEIGALESWMAIPSSWEESDASEKMARYSDLQGQLATEKSKGDASNNPLLNDLGVHESLLESTFGELSGGERSKVLLCKTLSAAKDTDLLMLDEPTNHMDIPTVEFIENFLMDLDGSVIVAAHDQYLLDNVADRVFEVDNQQVNTYEGNYTAYLGQREAYSQALKAKKRRDFNEVKRQLAIIEQLKSRNRFDSQVKSRKTRLSKQDTDDRVAPSERKSFRLWFDTERGPREVLEVEGLKKSFEGRTLFSGVNMEIEGGQKIGIVGPNGCGKSTLLKTLLGDIQPDEGTLKWGKKTNIGYFDQHHRTLEPERTLIDEARTLRDPPPPDEWSRGLLGRFHFSGDTVFKRVEQLSGGERARLALAKFIARQHNVLVLDEPTNHLDMDSQRIVAGALQEYEGTVIVVSHDRAFLDRVCDHIAIMAHGRVGVFPGNFSTAWTSSQLAKFTDSGVQDEFKVCKAFRDWEKDTRFHQGETIRVTGMETQAFRRMLRQAEANGWIEPLQAS